MSLQGGRLPSWQDQLSYVLALITRPRRGGMILISLLSMVLLGFIYTAVPENSMSSYNISSYVLPKNFHLPFSHEDDSAPLFDPLDAVVDDADTVPGRLKRPYPTFHLLMPAKAPTVSLCKNLLSLMILNYPPPTLVDFDVPKEEQAEKRSTGIYYPKLAKVYDYLNDVKRVQDGDLALIVDSDDVWFQLPPEVVIRRYHSIVKESNDRLVQKYGTLPDSVTGKPTLEPRFVERVLFGADKSCFPINETDLQCMITPPSSLREDAYGALTDKDSEGRRNRPRYLNGGTVIGPVEDLKMIYERALRKTSDRLIVMDEKQIFAEIFSDQEIQREVVRRASHTPSWREWLSLKLGTTTPGLDLSNITPPAATEDPEFRIGLDYESGLFQTMSKATDDIRWLAYSNHTLLPTMIYDQIHNETLRPATRSYFALPEDVIHASPPYSRHIFNRSSAAETKKAELLEAQDKKIQHAAFPNWRVDLDTLPLERTWADVPLATNLHVPAVPALLHLDKDASRVGGPDADGTRPWWTRMWFFPHGRALLRRAMRKEQGPIVAHQAAVGGEGWWDDRGGHGGVWTDRGEWLAWQEVCVGFEEQLFADGKGTWYAEDEPGGGVEGKEGEGS